MQRRQRSVLPQERQHSNHPNKRLTGVLMLMYLKLQTVGLLSTYSVPHRCCLYFARRALSYHAPALYVLLYLRCT